MDEEMTKIPLSQRLGGQFSQALGALQPNPVDRPYWVPEEHPVLLAWNMMLLEYCRVIGGNTRMCLDSKELTSILEEAWSIFKEEGQEVPWNIQLIELLGQIYWSTREEQPQDNQDPEWKDMLDCLAYVPDPDPPVARLRCNGEPFSMPKAEAYRETLERKLFMLLLAPFRALELSI